MIICVEVHSFVTYLYQLVCLIITDNVKEGVIIPPAKVVRYDEDDPYLVVAADKGTATFFLTSRLISGVCGDLTTKPPLAPSGTITVFLTCWAFIKPNTSVRKSSRLSDQRIPPRATFLLVNGYPQLGASKQKFHI